MVPSLSWELVKPGHILYVQYVPSRQQRPSSPITSLLVTSPRAKLVNEIIDRLTTVKFIQIRGSRASGKTTLLRLIQAQLEKDKKIVLLIDTPWPTERSNRLDLYWKFDALRRRCFENEIQTVVLIDEGQTTYTDFTLWNTYFKMWAGDLPGPFGVIVACVYGSVTQEMRTIIPHTSFILEHRQRIGLRPEVYTDIPLGRPSDKALGLLFDKEELEELYALAVAAKVMPPIDEPLKQLIFHWTEGYISIVSVIAKLIGERKERIDGNTIYTLEEFIQDYPQETFFQSLAADVQCRRFLPSQAISSDPRIIRVFSRLIVDGSIEYELGDQNPDLGSDLDWKDIDFAHEKGLIYMERTPISYSWLSCRITFAFPLQRALLQMSLCPPIPDLAENTSTLFRLITEVIKRFNPDHLKSPKRDRPLEATYQHEFYRCLYQVRPRALLSAEYSPRAGQTSGGRIDFLLHRQEATDERRRWAIELLRDDDRIHKHAYRFDQNGAYRSMLSDAMTEFRIIDFRTTVPTKPQPSIPDLLHVVFAPDYASATFYDNNNIQCGSFPFTQQ
ncbi:hypothetical protein B0H11DRAFT_2219241 [Mycena galericulata]|nr:hypothetical protein B0H11DRAFT_2219241 [Mycena galericulata]